MRTPKLGSHSERTSSFLKSPRVATKARLGTVPGADRKFSVPKQEPRNRVRRCGALIFQQWAREELNLRTRPALTSEGWH